MTTKDYLYLGLILLTALIFYCHGFYTGVYRCKRLYDKSSNEAEAEEDVPETTHRRKLPGKGATYDSPYGNN